MQLHPEYSGVARLDLLTHAFDRARIFLHRLDLGEGLAPRPLFRVRMHGAQPADIDEELLRFDPWQTPWCAWTGWRCELFGVRGTAKPCKVGTASRRNESCRSLPYPRRPSGARRVHFSASSARSPAASGVTGWTSARRRGRSRSC